MKVVLFCGGLGMRMRADNQSLPKPIMPIGSRPVLVSGSEFGDIVVRGRDGGALASFALDATVHGLLVNDTGEITVATSRGVVTVRIRL